MADLTEDSRTRLEEQLLRRTQINQTRWLVTVAVVMTATLIFGVWGWRQTERLVAVILAADAVAAEGPLASQLAHAVQWAGLTTKLFLVTLCALMIGIASLVLAFIQQTQILCDVLKHHMSGQAGS